MRVGVTSARGPGDNHKREIRSSGAGTQSRKLFSYRVLDRARVVPPTPGTRARSLRLVPG